MSSKLLSVPIVDLSPFTSGGDLESRKRAARELAEKGHKNGSVGISGHGVPSDIHEKAFQITEKLFDLPYEDKMKAPHPDGYVPHRGYSGIAKEQGAAKTALETDDEAQKAAIMKASDYKESYEIGSEENKVQYNIWMSEDVLPGFRTFMTDFYWSLNKAANAILEAIMMSLDLTEEEAESMSKIHTGHDNQLRLLHYPPISPEMLKNEAIGRLGAHTDFSTFTLLWQDVQSGLEFGDRETGDFMPAIAKEGVVYMNIGDMGQRISNGFYPSAIHRVVIAGKDTGEVTPARYSIPFFVAPFPEGLVEPQPSLVASHGQRVYEPITFAAYCEKMMKATQLIPDE